MKSNDVIERPTVAQQLRMINIFTLASLFLGITAFGALYLFWR